MKIIALSDIHSRLDYLQGIKDDLASADLVLIAGDITNFMGRNDAKRVISSISNINPNIFAIAGNCDLPVVDEYLTSRNINLNCNFLDSNSIAFTGLCGFIPAEKRKHALNIESFFKLALDELTAKIKSDKPFVLVTHQPARGTDADLAADKHCGSDALFDFIAATQPLLAISGHIHESPAIDRIANTTIVNPGPFCQGCYAQIEITSKGVEKTLLKYAQ